MCHRPIEHTIKCKMIQFWFRIITGKQSRNGVTFPRAFDQPSYLTCKKGYSVLLAIQRNGSSTDRTHY